VKVVSEFCLVTTIEEPREVRLVRRGDQLVLQQRWRITRMHASMADDGEPSEWRDVPVSEEGADGG
jgi:hypothetical protein